MKISENKIIQKLLPDFIESGIKDFTVVISEIIQKKDQSELYRLAHSWKGAAAQYELPEISQKSAELVEISKTDDWDKAKEVGNDILKMIYEVEELFYQTPKKKKYLL